MINKDVVKFQQSQQIITSKIEEFRISLACLLKLKNRSQVLLQVVIFNLLFLLLQLLIICCFLNMYSGQYMALQPNYYTSQYFNAPAYSFGNLFSIDEMPIFAINTFYIHENEVTPYFPTVKIENTLQNLQQKQRNQMQLKLKPKSQVNNYKIKTSIKRKNKKNSQKDDRNVVSNLLKIFFKNLLDLHKWDQYLKKLIQKYKIQTSIKRFFQWITTFRVNYRNYIKAKEIKVLLSVQQCRGHQLLFRTVLRRFIYLQGLTHCLTARRIDRASVERHVQGLRQIQALSTGKQL